MSIYYESRLARLELDEAERPLVDEEFEEVTEGEELEGKERYKTKWSALAALVGAEKRLGLVANDLLRHWEDRLSVMDGKAMIVCMKRSICVDLYNEIVKLRPEWRGEGEGDGYEDDDKGAIKVVMSGAAADPEGWQQHIRSKRRRERLAKRFRQADSSLRIVIVRDMWLTGFDAQCLHTMYVDKPMRGHGLMQAIARVNRVFHDKPGGLVVDYLSDQFLARQDAGHGQADPPQARLPAGQAGVRHQDGHRAGRALFGEVERGRGREHVTSERPDPLRPGTVNNPMLSTPLTCAAL